MIEKMICHEVAFCVVGGGLAGMFAAIAAARHGNRVVLMQDRPVLGGNASSEIRMWVRGAHGENNRETGLLEEVALENSYRNPTLNFSIWDSVLWGKVQSEENITLLLNCSCCDAVMEGDKIVSIKGWQTTTQTWHCVTAFLFADCSGDSILAPLTGAEFRMGRESKTEFDEDIAPEKADTCTMGMSCLFQARETGKPSQFIAPQWANHYTKEDFPFRLNLSHPTAWTTDNYWWMELGGADNSIDDTERLRDKLIKMAYGVWDFIKNSGCVDAENWELEWLGFLPGKRESRRYVGDYILTQNDVRAGGHFDDLVAYGGWSMDDHHPKGFETIEKPTIFHPAPSPYGIPYRCLYSKNIANLMFAGRNISVTHSAVSSCRVMATCAILGQAVGTAAAIAIREKVLPRTIYEKYQMELQQTLMRDDCYLPFHKYEVSSCMKMAKIVGNGEVARLINGYERTMDGKENAYIGKIGEAIEIEFAQTISNPILRIVFDSDINRESYTEDNRWYTKTFPMKANVFLNETPIFVPKTIIEAYEVYSDKGDGIWKLVYSEKNNYQRLNRIKIQEACKKIRLLPTKTHGADCARIYTIDVIPE